MLFTWIIVVQNHKVEQDTDNEEKFDEYDEKIMNLKKYMITLQKVCYWYRYDEKSTKFFYGLEKKNALCGTIKTLLVRLWNRNNHFI